MRKRFSQEVAEDQEEDLEEVVDIKENRTEKRQEQINKKHATLMLYKQLQIQTHK